MGANVWGIMALYHTRGQGIEVSLSAICTLSRVTRFRSFCVLEAPEPGRDSASRPAPRPHRRNRECNQLPRGKSAGGRDFGSRTGPPVRLMGWLDCFHESVRPPAGETTGYNATRPRLVSTDKASAVRPVVPSQYLTRSQNIRPYHNLRLACGTAWQAQPIRCLEQS